MNKDKIIIATCMFGLLTAVAKFGAAVCALVKVLASF